MRKSKKNHFCFLQTVDISSFNSFYLKPVCFQVVLKWAGVKNAFYLLGFETGVLVALELAAILEQHGK